GDTADPAHRHHGATDVHRHRHDCDLGDRLVIDAGNERLVVLPEAAPQRGLLLCRRLGGRVGERVGAEDLDRRIGRVGEPDIVGRVLGRAHWYGETSFVQAWLQAQRYQPADALDTTFWEPTRELDDVGLARSWINQNLSWMKGRAGGKMPRSASATLSALAQPRYRRDSGSLPRPAPVNPREARACIGSDAC